MNNAVARLALPVLLAPALIAGALLASPGNAAVLFDSVGDSHVFNYDGLTTSTGLAVAGTGQLDARLTLTLGYTDGYSWIFAYSVDNQAGAQFDRARITGFGFDVSSLPTFQPIATGAFDRVGSGTVVPGFDTDVCFMAAGSGCATNANAGLRADDGTEGGLFWLGYSGRQAMVELSNVYVRWQGSQIDRVVPRQTDLISVSALSAEPAPEPAAWALMITGFGLVGATMRRRRGVAAVNA